MAESVISQLTDAPSDLLDSSVIDNDLSERPTISPLPLALLRNRSRPLSTTESFTGYIFQHKGKRYTIKEKSAIKKGGKQSFIWYHGSELSCSGNTYPSWLCNIC